MAWLHRLRREAAYRLPWFLLALGLIVLVSAVSLLQPMPHIDRVLQDAAREETRQPPSTDTVIVAIDEKSIAALGNWPWPRAMHAEVLRQIAADGARCTGLDLLLNEPDKDNPGDDARLAAAIEEAGCVVLPMMLKPASAGAPGSPGSQPAVELLPIPILARAAAGVGHAHLAVDEDGVARSLYLREGFAGRSWPHFALAMQQATARAAGQVSPPGPDASVAAPQKPGPWLRSQHQVIVLTTGSPPFRTLSYIDVLQGRAPPGTFRDRFVLVGATAAGLGDTYPISAPQAVSSRPGVEIFASTLQAIRFQRNIVIATPWQNLAYNLIPVVIALLGLLWLRPLGVVTLICALVALRMGANNAQPWLRIQFAPAAGLLGLLLVYPLWSLMRLNAAERYLRWGTNRLNAAMDGLPAAPQRRPVGDFLDRQMSASSEAGLRMHDLQRFVRDGIDHMADATLVLNRHGLVLIANKAAARHWRMAPQRLIGRDVHELLADLRWSTTGAPMVPPGALKAHERTPILGEGEDEEGRIVLLRCVPFFDTGNQHVGWMTTLIDITTTRHAQSQRDEALRFISHDIREPSASILTAIELSRGRPDALSGAALLDRIERHAQTGLDLADDFVNLARAEAQPFRAEVLDLVALMQQSIDDAWALARKKQLRVHLTTDVDEALCVADRSLLTRALTNVLSNALKYAPVGSEVPCRVVPHDGQWAVSVQDNGPGIPAALQSQLFQPFNRLHRDSHPEVQGVGLGLLLVRTAVHRHGGTIEIDSACGAGCTVTLLIPEPTAAQLHALMAEDKG
ncbi:CHASE2 domain-containing protein [Variovorax sp. RHLX14]|uniref:CHASE2 domain-containing protein n=1 Tax=Variovorax sp. RHLX14 TaxID=1259731 RepID=UPI003F46D5C8